MSRSSEQFNHGIHDLLSASRVQQLGNTTQRGYGHRHQKIRLIHLAKEPLCRRCLAKQPPAYRSAKVSDHIKPIRDGGDPWDLANRQALCVACHSEKTTEDLKKRRESN